MTFITANPSVIKSTQRFTMAMASSTSVAATITAVDITKTQLRFLGYTNGADVTFTSDTNNLGSRFAKLALTNATTITATVAVAGGGGNSATVSGEITEFI